jgi:hypothetical protein
LFLLDQAWSIDRYQTASRPVTSIERSPP